MYAFTAAHKTLPLPSFARVTNLDNGRSVVVRVNDRGPFHDGRVIDLSYAAAVKLDIVTRGTGRVEVRALSPEDMAAPVPAAATRVPASPSPAPASATARVGADAAATALDQWVQALPAVPAAATHREPDTTASAAPLLATDGATDQAVAAAPMLQVASFSSLDNARRALERLLAAGISNARLDDVVSGGRTLWRLRVAPAGTDAAELAGRIAGLGFGMPQTVRE